MTEERILKLLEGVGAVIPGHFVGTSGKHLSVYVDKDELTPYTTVVSKLCMEISDRFSHANIQVVVAPAMGAIVLGSWTAYHLKNFYRGFGEVLSVYAEPDDETIPGSDISDSLLKKDEKLIIRRPGLKLKRSTFAEKVRGKRTLVVEDVVTTGGSLLKAVKAAQEAGGIIVGAAVLVNGGDVSVASCGVDRLVCLANIKRRIFTEEECLKHGMCAEGVPVNPKPGHGQAFLDRLTRKF
jgi:orotate phosphoribosyltransferase